MQAQFISGNYCETLTSLVRWGHQVTSDYVFPLPCRHSAAEETWRRRGSGIAAGGVQTVPVLVFLKLCGILTPGPCPCPRAAWDRQPGAPGLERR